MAKDMRELFVFSHVRLLDVDLCKVSSNLTIMEAPEQLIFQNQNPKQYIT